MSQTRVGDGSRSPVNVSQGRVVGRPKLLNSPSLQPSAAPMPRFGSVCDESVWRVPKLTNFSTVAFIRAALTGPMMARKRASGEGGGAAPITNAVERARQASGVFIR